MNLFKDIFSTIINSAANGLVIAVFITTIITYVKERSLSNYINKLNARQNRFVLYFLAYVYMMFYKTVISRSGNYKPLSKVWGGWKIPVYQYVGFSHNTLIGNILLFLVFSLLLMLTFNHLFKSSKSAIITCTSLSFAVSLSIELCQLIFRRGTFQISDLVYNTLGGLLGVVIFLAVKNRIKKAD